MHLQCSQRVKQEGPFHHRIHLRCVLLIKLHIAVATLLNVATCIRACRTQGIVSLWKEAHVCQWRWSQNGCLLRALTNCWTDFLLDVIFLCFLCVFILGCLVAVSPAGVFGEIKRDMIELKWVTRRHMFDFDSFASCFDCTLKMHRGKMVLAFRVSLFGNGF